MPRLSHTHTATVGSFSHSHNEAKTPGVRAGATGSSVLTLSTSPSSPPGTQTQSASRCSEWLAAPLLRQERRGRLLLEA